MPATAVGYGYDNANNNLSEDQTATGLPVWHVAGDRGADRNRISLSVDENGVNKYGLFFDYTSRNELLDIRNSSNAIIFKYGYDANGNVTKRTGVALNDSTTMPLYDELNRPKQWLQFGLNAGSDRGRV